MSIASTIQSNCSDIEQELHEITDQLKEIKELVWQLELRDKEKPIISLIEEMQRDRIGRIEKCVIEISDESDDIDESDDWDDDNEDAELPFVINSVECIEWNAPNLIDRQIMEALESCFERNIKPLDILNALEHLTPQ